MKQGLKLLAQNGIFIALLTFLAYLLSYVYNMGYGNYYHIPKELVTFSMPSLFSSLTTLLAGLLIISSLANSVSTRSLENHTRTTMVANFAYLFVFWMAALTVQVPKIIHVYIAVYAGTYVLFHLLLPLAGWRKYGGYWASVDKNIENHGKNAENLYEHFLNLIYKHYFRYILLGLGALVVAYGLGGYNAKRQQNYFVMNDKKDWVAVRFIDDKVVLAERKSDTLTGNIKLVSIPDEKGTNISIVHTGRLAQAE